MRKEAAESPWGAFAFAVVFLMLAFLVADRLGAFAPGPVLRNLTMYAGISAASDAVALRIEGDKTTDDVLRARVASWIFSDGTAMAVALDAVEDTVQTRQAGDHFVSQVYSARIPSAARTDAGARLRVCFVYDPGLSCVEKPFSEISG